MAATSETTLTAFSPVPTLICLLAVSYAVLKLLKVGQRSVDLPPGPRTLPLIGNLHLMPTFKPYKQFAEWSKTYGPIYSLMVGSSPLIMVQSPEVARELLDKRGSNYSSRPDFYIFSELCSRGLRLVAMRYNSTWRQIHRMNHKILNANATEAYTPYQVLESRQMLVDILDRPADHEKHIKRFSYSLACQMVYGFRATDVSDPKLQDIHTIFYDACVLAVSTPARIMDCYPILRKIPNRLIPVCRDAMELGRRYITIYRSLWLEGKKKVQDGTSMPCFCASLVQAQKIEGISDDRAPYIAGVIIEAGSTTTTEELMGFLLAMVTHPDVQRQAQEELDSVVGTGRLPTVEDMASLPYIRGCVKETLRWMPTAALSVPHSPLKDDTYQGYRIPAGASVVLNVWALNMDPTRWPNPRVFDPSRYKDEMRSEHEIAMSSDPSSLRHNYVFGTGRRFCQGVHIAERSLFLAMACLLWAFDISTPDISKIDTEDLRGGLEVVPAPFECHMKPRDTKRANVMRQEWCQLQNEFLDPVTKQWIRAPDGLPLSTYSDN